MQADTEASESPRALREDAEQARRATGVPEGVEEVVVTARLRSENLMQVPDSITAFSADQIATRQLFQLTDFLALTPNAKMIREQDTANNEVYIRGVGSNKGQASAVAFVVDGVTLPDSDAYTVDLSEAEQVEILKGPQGALYGKGALAGAINIRTREPTNEVRVDGKMLVGSDDTFGGFASLSGPIVEDVLLGNVSLKYNETDGPFTNQFDGSGLAWDRNWKAAAKLLANPSDRIALQFATSYFTQKGGSPPYNAVDVLGTGSQEITSSQAGAPISHDLRDLNHRDVFTAALTASLDIEAGRLSSISAFDTIDFDFIQDVDFTELNVVTAGQVRHSRGASQEFRFTSAEDRRLRYIVTTYFERTKKDVVVHAELDFCFLGVIACPTPPGEPSGTLVPLPLQDTQTETDAYAIAAQLSYDITPELELTLAGRYDSNRPEQWDRLNSIPNKTTFSDWQPKASLAYKPHEALTLYTTYAHGFKPGSFNPPQPPGSPFPRIVKQEATDNLEIGAKTSFFDRRLLLNAAAFVIEYENAQQFHLDVQTGGNQSINVRESRIKGFEVDLAARIASAFDVNASYGYTKSEIRDFDGSSSYLGQSLPYQPRYTLNLGAQYTREIATDLELTARADFARNGRTSFQDFQNPNEEQFLFQSSDQSLDLRLGMRKGAWAVTLFGRNVTDEQYVYSAYSRFISTLIFGPLNSDVLLPAPGRTWGVEFRVSL